jgi:hypothetical protein
MGEGKVLTCLNVELACDVSLVNVSPKLETVTLTCTTMSLLQDVLRSHVPDSATLEKRLNNVVNKAAQGSSSDESDDELVNVVSHSTPPPPLIHPFIAPTPRSHSQAPLPAHARPRPRATAPLPAPSPGPYTSHRAAISSRPCRQRYPSAYLANSHSRISRNAPLSPRNGVDPRR